MANNQPKQHRTPRLGLFLTTISAWLVLVASIVMYTATIPESVVAWVFLFALLPFAYFIAEKALRKPGERSGGGATKNGE